jgi:cell division septum initiation protein DivIVA
MPKMHINETQLVSRLHSAELPHSLRGFDEEATRQLLNEAADAFEKACEQRDQARSDLHVAKEQASGVSADAEAVGRALLAAQSTGEQIIALANEQAGQLIDEVKAESERLLAEATTAAEQVEAAREALQREQAEERQRLAADRQEVIASARAEVERELGNTRAEADRVLAEARAEADRLLADAHAEVARVRREAEEISAYLESKRAAFVEMASAALERLDRIEDGGGRELVVDLHPVEHRSESANP